MPIVEKKDTEAAEKQIVDQAKRIEFFVTEYSVELLTQKMQKGDFVIPAYQREFTWEPERKWRFIESLLIGLPVPFLFFWEQPEGKLEIVDGSQRLRTLEEFVYGDLVLGPLNKIPAVSDFSFGDLPESRRRKFLNRSIRGIVLNEHADFEARFDLFERINTGSKVANPAEVRRGALTGPFMDLVVSLAKNAKFMEMTPVSSKRENEREREELVTRFFAYGDGLDDYADDVSPFLFRYAKKMNSLFGSNATLAQQYEKRFVDTLQFVETNFPDGFRRSQSGSAIPRARFESIAVGSYLAMLQKTDLAPGKEAVTTWLKSDEFAKVTGSDGANAIGRLQSRIYFVRDHLAGN